MTAVGYPTSSSIPLALRVNVGRTTIFMEKISCPYFLYVAKVFISSSTGVRILYSEHGEHDYSHETDFMITINYINSQSRNSYSLRKKNIPPPPSSTPTAAPRYKSKKVYHNIKRIINLHPLTAHPLPTSSSSILPDHHHHYRYRHRSFHHHASHQSQT